MLFTIILYSLVPNYDGLTSCEPQLAATQQAKNKAKNKLNEQTINPYALSTLFNTY